MTKEILKHHELDYVIRHPENFDPAKKYPLVIYLHGAGGRGREIQKIYDHHFFRETEEILTDVVSVAPQCYSDTWFNIFEQLQQFIEDMIHMDYIDTTRVYMLGASMGGYGTWQMAMARPEWFAAIVPICGGGMYWNTKRLKNMGVWAFHGAQDDAVLCVESIKMVNGVNKNGGKAKLTVYEDMGHKVWNPTFRNREMWAWMFSHTNAYEDVRSELNSVEQYG